MSDNINIPILSQLIATAQTPRTVDGTPYVLKPDNFSVESLESLQEHPARKRAHVRLSTMESFIQYINEHKQPSSRIFAAIGDTGAGFMCVVDYHEANTTTDTEAILGKANWGNHRIFFSCEHTIEWKRWTTGNKRPMTQVAFAEFLEENMLSIVSPPGADMLELVQTLEAKKNVRFDSTQRLANGKTVLTYEEDINLSGTGSNKGKLEFPQELTLGIKPFKGALPFKIKARLRYRIQDRAMSFWYDLIDPHVVIELVCAEMLTAIKDETGLTTFQGAAPEERD